MFVCIHHHVFVCGGLGLSSRNTRGHRDVTPPWPSSFVQTAPCPHGSDGHMCSQLTLASFPMTWQRWACPLVPKSGAGQVQGKQTWSKAARWHRISDAGFVTCGEKSHKLSAAFCVFVQTQLTFTTHQVAEVKVAAFAAKFHERLRVTVNIWTVIGFWGRQKGNEMSGKVQTIGC